MRDKQEQWSSSTEIGTTVDRRALLIGGIALAFASTPTADSIAADSVPTATDPPRSRFGERSTAEEVTTGLDLRGKTALITGCNAGIGLETMRVLVLRGAHVLGLARTVEKATRACAAVVTKRSAGKATPFVCEQSDFRSVAACADAVRALDLPLDMLICNAGVAFIPTLNLIHGVDEHFAVNHLSHFILVNRLLPEVRRAFQGRIVIVGSIGYKAARNGIAFDNLSGQLGYDPGLMYAQSKLANGLVTWELSKRLAGTTTTANVLHPGTVETGIFRHVAPELRPRENRISGAMSVKNVAQGAATICYVATNPDLAKISGAYFEDCNGMTPGGHMRNDAMAIKLWAVSEDMTRPYLLSA